MGGSVSVPKEQENEIHDLFVMLDLDGSGSLSKTELYEFCMQSASLTASGGAEDLIRTCDTNADGGISPKEWMKMWQEELKGNGIEGLRSQVDFFA